MVCLNVDDMIYMGSSQSITDDFKSSMIRRFEMTNLDLLKYFLGLVVIQGNEDVFLSQDKFASECLKKNSHD